MGNYTPQYDNTDVVEAGTDTIGAVFVTVASFAGIIVLVGLAVWGVNKFRRA